MRQDKKVHSSYVSSLTGKPRKTAWRDLASTVKIHMTSTANVTSVPLRQTFIERKIFNATKLISITVISVTANNNAGNRP